jgi:hypothetical protein
MPDECIRSQPPASIVVADNPYQERIFADRAAPGMAKQHGGSYGVDPDISGIDGWLILPALNLIFSPIWIAFWIYQAFSILPGFYFSPQQPGPPFAIPRTV